MLNILPCVVFGFNRPHKLKRILKALRTQGIEKLIIFIDGPRNQVDVDPVEMSRKIARDINWVEKELYFWDENRGLSHIINNISLVFENHLWAVFVEDDCLPMPGFYNFMRDSLERYRDDRRVFSIGGYQPIEPSYFHGYHYNLVSTARFTCWGWATWSDRWQELYPYIIRYHTLFNNLNEVPDLAGTDLSKVAKTAIEKQDESWDIKVALATLWLKKVHLLTTPGLIRNIGLTFSGIHSGLRSGLRNWRFQNRNIAKEKPKIVSWLEDTSLNCDYACRYRDFIQKNRGGNLWRLWQRGRKSARRYLWPIPERFFNQDLLAFGPEKLKKLALVSYIVHPFSISRDDIRFYRHINIWHAQEMVRVLNRMGFHVDVIDYRDKRFKPKQTYDLFIGHGGTNFSRIAGLLPEHTPKLYFSTGSHWLFHNEQEKLRFAAFRQRRGVYLPYDRYIHHDEENALKAANGIFGIGNQHTRQTYDDFKNVRMLDGTSLSDASFDWFQKNYETGRNHFVFFSGRGNIHKGLDLVLEAFNGIEQHLWICTPLEKDFAAVYKNELKLSNIHVIGWLQPRSPDFYRVMRTCNFCILPSCSEGQSQSVVECLNQGLIPLVSRETGLDVKNFGFIIELCSPPEIRKLVQKVATFQPQYCQELSQMARQAALNDFSEARFSQNLQSILEALLP